MALIHRISRLFTADLHAVLDRLEEPEALLKQAVREMEELLRQSEQRAKLLELEQGELKRRREAVARATAGIDEELDLCLAQGEETLARSLVRRKLEAERATRNLDTRLAEIDRQLVEQNVLLEEQRRELDSVRQKAELFVAPSREGAIWSSGDSPVSGDEVEVGLLREKRIREQRHQDQPGEEARGATS